MQSSWENMGALEINKYEGQVYIKGESVHNSGG